MLDLTTKEGIRDAAERPIEHLKVSYEDNRGISWTEHNFQTLQEFCKDQLGIGSEDCFYKGSEFLWDFLGIDQQRGILLAAESEQSTDNQGQQRDLLHGFEKLLYVYAPLRLLICKCKSDEQENPLIGSLQQYANGCCKIYNPGAAFYCVLRILE